MRKLLLLFFCSTFSLLAAATPECTIAFKRQGIVVNEPVPMSLLASLSSIVHSLDLGKVDEGIVLYVKRGPSNLEDLEASDARTHLHVSIHRYSGEVKEELAYGKVSLAAKGSVLLSLENGISVSCKTNP